MDATTIPGSTALERSGLIGRRAARADLDAAEDVVQRSRHHLHQVGRIAAGPNERRDAATGELQEARREVRTHDLFRSSERHVAEGQRIERTIDALDTWREWADGRTVT